MIRAILMSVGNVAIIPAQDLLGLRSEARMNRPGVERGNWAFRLAAGALTPAIADRLRALCVTYDRVRASA
jgi:4-alpha-glucanotransferase